MTGAPLVLGSELPRALVPAPRAPGLGALAWPRLLDVNEVRVLLLATGVPRVYHPQSQEVASGRGYQPCALAGQAGPVHRKTT